MLTDGGNLNVEMSMNTIAFPISADFNEWKKSLISADNQQCATTTLQKCGVCKSFALQGCIVCLKIQ